MRLPLRLAAVLLVVALPAAPAAQQSRTAATPRPSVALTNARVLDVRTGRLGAGLTIVVKDGVIASVAAGSAPAGMRTLDVGGRVVLPGLIDAHTHLDTVAGARLALASGVTTVRSASVGSFRDVALRDLVRSGRLPGPDVVAAGLYVTPRIDDEDLLVDPAMTGLGSEVRSDAALRELVRINLRHGVDVIKTRGTERAGLADTDPRQQTYTEAQLRVIVEEAATKGVPVQAHAHGDEGARAAVLAGVRSIEHGTYLSEETLALMKQRGTWLVPTYATIVDMGDAGAADTNPALRVRARHMLPRLREAVARAYRLGVPLATGIDHAYTPDALMRVSHEVGYLVEIGVAPIDAIRAATTSAAALLRLEKHTGSIEPGLEADLIAVERNPIESIGTLEDPLLVMSNGFVVVDRLKMGL